jgi:hypothetical protein
MNISVIPWKCTQETINVYGSPQWQVTGNSSRWSKERVRSTVMHSQLQEWLTVVHCPCKSYGEPETNQAVSNSNHFQAEVKPHKKNLAFPQYISYTAIPNINLHIFHGKDIFMEWDLLLNCGDLLVRETTIVACHNMRKNKESMQQEGVPLMKKGFVVFMR